MHRILIQIWGGCSRGCLTGLLDLIPGPERCLFRFVVAGWRCFQMLKHLSDPLCLEELLNLVSAASCDVPEEARNRSEICL